MFFTSTPSISPADASQKISQPHTAFIDVREPGEYSSGHAKGAYNIPLSKLGDSEISSLKSSEAVYVICQSGGRSSKATKKILKAGVKAINISGGTSAWRSLGLPMA